MSPQEPVQAAVWHALNNYCFYDARFLAERLHAEVHSDETLHLLATCYYRSGKKYAAYSILKSRSYKTPECRFLFAKCCADLNLLREAEFALVGSIFEKIKSVDEVALEFGELGSYALQLLGQILCRTTRFSKAAEAYSKSLKLNPYLWSSFEGLVNIGVKPDASKFFITKNRHDPHVSCHPYIHFITVNSGAKESPPVHSDIAQDSSQVVIGSKMYSSSPLSFLQPSTDATAEVNSSEDSTCVSFSGISKNNKNTRNTLFTAQNTNSPLSPCLSALPMATPTSHQDSGSQPAANLKQMSKRSPPELYTPKYQVFSSSGNKNNNSALSQTPQTSLPPVNISNVRRSSRLFSSSNSVKENNKGSTRTGRFISSKAPPKKPKAKTTRATISEPKEIELNEINKADAQGENIHASPTSVLKATAGDSQKPSFDNLMQIYHRLGTARALLATDMKKAVQELHGLPARHFLTGLVQSMMGRAYFELANYEESILRYQEARKHEPYRLEGLEYYSTALWHQQQEVTLATLAHELTEKDTDKESPELWCVVGNCMSLQKEHESAIKFLQRAIQVDPNFVYAYTLLGHEHVATEEMEKAMKCFRNAIRIDPRHYNAWYGIGMIYFKQEKFYFAELHYKKALQINPENAVLMCHIGVVQQALKRYDMALRTLNRAVAMNPSNPLCKFHRASVYYSLDKYSEALKDLDELKQLVPQESLVYFLIGNVHKKLGNPHLTLMNFSWATDLDPRGANNQIKGAIERQYNNEEDDVVVPAHVTSDVVRNVEIATFRVEDIDFAAAHYRPDYEDPGLHGESDESV